MLMKPETEAIHRVVRMALLEDAPWGDLTSQAFIPADAQAAAQLNAREPGVLSGSDVFTAAMQLTDAAIEVRFLIEDGQRFSRGDALATVRGPARGILQAERVALNFVQRMSGIAALTARFVKETEGTRARIVDTRKTTPGLRLLERYAVRCGGGSNHRFSLSDAVMVKDNHLEILAAYGAGDLVAALSAARRQLPHTTTVEVEVDRLDQIESMLAAGADTVMLDNFTTDQLTAGVALIAGRALVEASGGMKLERIHEVAATGVDVISVGALTHSALSLDLALDIQPPAGLEPHS